MLVHFIVQSIGLSHYDSLECFIVAFTNFEVLVLVSPSTVLVLVSPSTSYPLINAFTNPVFKDSVMDELSITRSFLIYVSFMKLVFSFSCMQDFEDALQEVRPSVSLNELGTYEEWNKQFGSLSL